MKNVYFFLLLLLISIGSSAQWSQVNTGIASLTAGASLLGSSDTYLFAKANGKMYRTNDNGDHWAEIAPPVPLNTTECGYYFSGKYFAGMNASTDCIYYSTDNGSNWNATTGSPTASVVRGFIGLGANIFAYTSNKGIYKSTDGGLNWAAANTGLTNLNVIKMEVISSKLVAITIGAGVFISTDNGANWVQSNSGISSGGLNASLVWRMGTELFYTEQGGGAYKSIDEGASWTTWIKPTVMGISPVEIFRKGANFYVKSRFLATGLTDSIFITSNEGSTWKNITANLPANLNGSGIMEFNGYAFYAYNLSSPGLGIYRSGTSTGLSEKSIARELTFYPNPTNGKLYLNVGSSIIGNKYFVYDQFGKQIMKEDITDSNTSIDLSSFANGIYYIGIDRHFLHKVVKY
jgi:photosystem II stability/assembly factor-like uncharacterized protein